MLKKSTKISASRAFRLLGVWVLLLAASATQAQQAYVFVDGGVEDYQELLLDLDESTRVVILDSDTDGLEQPGAQMQQRADGQVVMEFPDSESKLVPIRAYKTGKPAPGEAGFWTDSDGYLSIRTSASLEIILYPMFTDKDALETAVEAEDPAYAITYGIDSDFSITKDRNTGASATLPRYAGRPGLSAGRVTQRPLERPQGLYFYPSPWLANVGAASLITRNEAGDLMEQELVPTPADWPAFKARVQAERSVSSVSISPRGVITIKEYGRAAFSVLADYEVTPNAATASANRPLLFINAGDVNGDGEDDYYSYYPNGDRQLLYVFPR